jgi:hypothetical protein
VGRTTVVALPFAIKASPAIDFGFMVQKSSKNPELYGLFKGSMERYATASLSITRVGPSMAKFSVPRLHLWTS